MGIDGKKDIHIVYLANVGTRDVQLDGEYIYQPRVEGKRLLEAYEAVKERLSAPILVPGLAHAVQEAGFIDRVVLFVTDQPAHEAERYRNLDTLYFGDILKRLLKEVPQVGVHLGEIVVERIPGNPARLQETLPFYEQSLPRLVPEDVETVYVAPVGGADASNEALWITAIRRFTRRVQLIYVMPNGEVTDLPLGRVILDDYARQRARAMLERYDYMGLAAMLEEMPWRKDAWLPFFLRALGRRLHFDFRGAMEELEQALKRAEGGRRARIRRLMAELSPWLEEPVPPRSGDPQERWDAWLDRQRKGLAELYWNIQVKIRREEWVDVLGRLFRLTEGLERLVFELETGHSTEKLSDDYEDFVAAVRGDEALWTFLQENKVREPLTPNTWVLQRIIAYWVTEEGLGPKYGSVYSLLKTISALSHLRNKTIIAHGWQGVSQRDVEQEAGKGVDALMRDVQKALKSVGINLDEDPFVTYGNVVRDALDA